MLNLLFVVVGAVVLVAAVGEDGLSLGVIVVIRVVVVVTGVDSAFMRVFMQQRVAMLFAQLLCPQTSEPSHSESAPQSPSPSKHGVILQYLEQ